MKGIAKNNLDILFIKVIFKINLLFYLLGKLFTAISIYLMIPLV